MTALVTTLKHWLFTRNSMILIGNFLLFATLINTLPFESQVNTGLSILIFVAVLWLTEAIHVSITALLVPLLAVVFGVFQYPCGTSKLLQPNYLSFPRWVCISSGIEQARARQSDRR